MKAQRYGSDVWEAIRDEYRAGALSIRAIADRHGPTEAAIRARARKEKWERDLSEQVRAATRAKQQRDETKSSRPAEIIEAAAARNIKALRQHMHSLGRLAEIEETLSTRIEKGFADLARLDDDGGTAARVEQALSAAAENPRQRTLKLNLAGMSPEMERAHLLRILSGCVGDLAGTTARRIALERQALNLDKPEEDKAQSGFVFHCDLGGGAAHA